MNASPHTTVSYLLLGPQLVERIPLAQVHQKLQESILLEVSWANLFEVAVWQG